MGRQLNFKNQSQIISLVLLVGILFMASLHHAGFSNSQSAQSQLQSQATDHSGSEKLDTHLEVSESLGQRGFEVGAGLSLADNQRAGNAKVSSGERLRQ